MKHLKPNGLGRRLPLLAGAAVALTMSVLSGCAPKPAPPPPPPPPVVVIPQMPTPPNGAPTDMTIPPVDATGNRHTVNTGISTPQAVWNLRSAYNVAALNCIEPQYTPILDGYKRFLKVYAKQLAAANKAIDASFGTQASGRAATVARETYQTQVYNFFSLPPVDSGFCQAAMDVTTELQTVDPTQFEAYSFTGLAKMEAPFKSFFTAYEQYKADLAAWQARYGGGLITVRPSVAQQVTAQQSRPPQPIGPLPSMGQEVTVRQMVQPQPVQLQPIQQQPGQSQPTVQLPSVEPQVTARQPNQVQPGVKLPGFSQ